MSSTTRRVLMLLVILSVAAFAWAEPGKEPAAMATGEVDLKSAGQLAFGPDLATGSLQLRLWATQWI